MRTATILIVTTIATASAVPLAARPKSRLPAAANARVVDDLLACKTIAATDARLACFDRTTAALADAQSRKQLVVLDREGTKQVKAKVFGFSTPSLKLFGGGSDEPEVTEIDSTLTRVEDAPNAMFRYYLADGSVWQTVEETYGNPPRKDEKIRIKAGMLGSYSAIAGKSRAVRVKRIR